jgi:hypothetical protein
MIYEDTILKNKLKSNCYKKVTQKFNKSKQMEVFKNNIID